MSLTPLPDKNVSRRRFLQFGAAGLLVVGGGAYVLTRAQGGLQAVGPGAEAVRLAEAARRATGTVVRRDLRAAPVEVDLAGRVVRTWAYDGVMPGTAIRVRAGDELRVRLTNELPAETTVHWHGLALGSDKDGVPGLTEDPIASGSTFEYAFVVPDAGTHWCHPRVGVQPYRGLQAQLIVEDLSEPLSHDERVILVLDDRSDGCEGSPDATVQRMAREGMVSASEPLGADTGDVVYPAHLVNGRVAGDPFVFKSAPGRRIRLRIINAGGDTAYRFAVGGHRLTVTHADGFPVNPVEVEALINGAAFADHEPLEICADERGRLVMRNESMMFHLIHVLGHTFAVASAQGRAGMRKDTINVLPMETVAVDLQADNPGQWAIHFHNIYHGEPGTMTVLSYVS